MEYTGIANSRIAELRCSFEVLAFFAHTTVIDAYSVHHWTNGLDAARAKALRDSNGTHFRSTYNADDEIGDLRRCGHLCWMQQQLKAG